MYWIEWVREVLDECLKVDLALKFHFFFQRKKMYVHTLSLWQLIKLFPCKLFLFWHFFFPFSAPLSLTLVVFASNIAAFFCTLIETFQISCLHFSILPFLFCFFIIFFLLMLLNGDFIYWRSFVSYRDSKEEGCLSMVASSRKNLG